MPAQRNQCLTVKDVAAKYQRKPAQVREWIRRGWLVAFQPGGRGAAGPWMIDPAALALLGAPRDGDAAVGTAPPVSARDGRYAFPLSYR